MTIAEIFAVIRDGGIIATLLVVIAGGFYRLYVWKWQYEEVIKDRDDWKRIALKALNITDRVV